MHALHHYGRRKLFSAREFPPCGLDRTCLIYYYTIYANAQWSAFRKRESYDIYITYRYDKNHVRAQRTLYHIRAI